MDQSAAGHTDAYDFETRSFGDVTLIRGHCLAVLPALGPNSISMIFADLPYMSTLRESSANPWDRAVSLPEFWAGIAAVAKQGAPSILTASQPFASILIYSNLKKFRYDIIWDKVVPSRFLHAKNMPLCRHEHLLVFAKGKILYNPQMIKRDVPVKSGGPSTSTNYRRPKSEEWIKKIYTHKYPSTIIAASKNDKPRLHPTQKPVALLEWLIRTYTNDGDTILDPVAGSGSFAIAAMNVGNRKVVCIEKDPTYYEIMCKRIAEHQQKLAAIA